MRLDIDAFHFRNKIRSLIFRLRAQRPGTTQPRRQRGIVKQPADRDSERVRVVGRHRDRFVAVSRDLRHARRQRSVDDRQSCSHRLDLRNAESLGSGDRRKREQARGIEMDFQLIARNEASEQETLGHAEALGQPAQRRFQRTVADDGYRRVDLRHGPDQGRKSLVGHQTPGGDDKAGVGLPQAFDIVLLTGVELLPIADVGSERHHDALRRMGPEKTRVGDHRGIGHDDAVGPSQRVTNERCDERHHRLPPDDLRMPMDYESDPVRQLQGDADVVQGKRQMGHDDIDLARGAPQHGREDGRKRHRQQIAQ